MADDKLKQRAREVAVRIHLKLTASSQSKHFAYVTDAIAAFAAELVAEARVEEAKWWNTVSGDRIITTGELKRKHMAELKATLAALRTPQTDATAPAAFPHDEGSTPIDILAELDHEKYTGPAGKLMQARELPPVAPPAQVSPAMDIESIVKQVEHTNTCPRNEHAVVKLYGTDSVCPRCALESYATSQRELRKGLPKPENMKWLLDAANQVISELSKQEHLDSETFRWLCNAVGQVERDLKRSAILEGKV